MQLVGQFWFFPLVLFMKRLDDFIIRYKTLKSFVYGPVVYDFKFRSTVSAPIFRVNCSRSGIIILQLKKKRAVFVCRVISVDTNLANTYTAAYTHCIYTTTTICYCRLTVPIAENVSMSNPACMYDNIT